MVKAIILLQPCFVETGLLIRPLGARFNIQNLSNFCGKRFWSKWLCEEASATFKQTTMDDGAGSVTGHVKYLDCRPALSRTLCKLWAADPGHDNVCQQQIVCGAIREYRLYLPRLLDSSNCVPMRTED